VAATRYPSSASSRWPMVTPIMVLIRDYMDALALS
jgi:hypothetical protein